MFSEEGTNVTPEPTNRNDPPHTPHQRDWDEQEAANRPLQAKDKPPITDRGRDPHAALNNPVGEPDPAATSDPFDPDPASQGDND
jgi:hypothetical protein